MGEKFLVTFMCNSCIVGRALEWGQSLPWSLILYMLVFVTVSICCRKKRFLGLLPRPVEVVDPRGEPTTVIVLNQPNCYTGRGNLFLRSISHYLKQKYLTQKANSSMVSV